MRRRDFLTSLAGSAGLALATGVRPALGMEHMHHAAGGAPSPQPPHDPSAAGARKGSLAASDAIPPGRPFAAPATLGNTAAQPGMFRATLVAAPAKIELIPGVMTQAWAYNGQFPGPLIDLQAGDAVEITLENRLPEPTTIHWHGLPVPPDQDGNPDAAVAPGASHTYRFHIPDDVEGLYWYHPHPHGRSGEQVYRGLAGAIRVRARQDALSAIPERILAITDLRLTALGMIPENDMMDWMNGREGQFALVNGLNRPTLPFDALGRERWHILNATNARYLRLALPGHDLTLLGTDGGRIEQAQTGLSEILVAPAQRVELLVTAAGGRGGALVAETYARGKMGGASETSAIPLMQVDFSAVRQPRPLSLPQPLRPFQALPKASARKRVVMSEGMSMAHGSHGAQAMEHTMSPGGMGMTDMKSMMTDGRPSMMQFMLNGKTFDMRRVDLSSPTGAWEDWEIVNDSDMDHPFHIHGTQFAVLERMINGRTAREPFRAWYDTVNLKARETVRIRIMQAAKGIRMFHCHILEHEDLGMMGRLEVI
ncbi:multicopper oxidase family protein [Castellaniella sp.]|uniref:multicopper oxidase family protein n=1 Tax=Castellaniella sp. TaxID=1955812 RepID=UPI003C734EF6